MRKWLTLAALAFATAAHASVNGSDTILWDALELDEVTVTGTRVPRPLKDTPVQTRLITRADIVRSDASDIRGLLEQTLPGAEFSYSMNQQVHLNFNGFGGQSLLFLIDGERLAGETMDDVDFSRIDLAGVERVEIVRGASGALYGSNAVGGVVNVITRKPHGKWDASLDFRAGKHSERRYAGSLGFNAGAFSNSLSATASRASSYGVASALGADSRVFATVYGHKTLNVSDRLQWRALDNLRFTGRAGFYMKELPRQTDAPERYRAFSGGLRGEWDITPADRLEISYSFDQYDKADYRRLSGMEIRSYSDVLNSVRAFYNHDFGPCGALSAGSEYSHEYLLNARLGAASRSQDAFAAFAQYEWSPSPSFEAVATARYDRFSEGSVSRLTPRVSLRWTPLSNLNLRAAWGMGFRAPSLKERYYEFDMAGLWIVKGNPSLKPEQGHNVDLSAEYTCGRFNVTATGFFNRIRNRITTGLPYSLPGDSRQLYLDYINLARSTAAGVELSGRAAWEWGLRATAAYSYTRERVGKDKGGNAFNSQYMPLRPHSLTASADWLHDWAKGWSFSASLSGRALSAVTNREYKDLYDISKGTVRVRYPAYTIWKLTLSQTIRTNFKVTVAVDNLFDYRPRQYYLNAPLTDGTSLTVGLGWTL